MSKKQYIMSALVAVAFTLGMSTGEAKARKDHAHGKAVKEKQAPKKMIDKKKKRSH